jgi:hypothetical protein
LQCTWSSQYGCIAHDLSPRRMLTAQRASLPDQGWTRWTTKICDHVTRAKRASGERVTALSAGRVHGRQLTQGHQPGAHACLSAHNPSGRKATATTVQGGSRSPRAEAGLSRAPRAVAATGRLELALARPDVRCGSFIKYKQAARPLRSCLPVARRIAAHESTTCSINNGCLRRVHLWSRERCQRRR